MRSRPWRVLATLCAAVLYTSTARTQDPSPDVPAQMKAVRYHTYGSSEVLRLEEIDTPLPEGDQVLIRVRAASVNPFDWHFMRGTPYFMRLTGAGFFKPKETRIGVDFAGTVEAIGKDVKLFQRGDEVFGAGTGAFAEYV